MNRQSRKIIREECDGWLEELMEYIEENHRIVREIFEREIPSIKVNKPEATYFAWIDFRSLKLSKEEMEDLFENKARVIVEVGHKFGQGGDGFIRFNLGCKREMLIEGVERIIKAVKEL